MIELLQSQPFFSDKTIESCTFLEHQGYCNENYLVCAESKKYIARKLLRDDIDRDFEWTIQNLAYQQDITAEPLVFDKKNRFMLFAFLEGEHKRELNKHGLRFLAKTLQKLHSISIEANPIELHIKTKTDEVIKAFGTIAKYPKDCVLCHNDLNPQNIFFSNDVKFIDWEYASMNDRYFDLASVCVEFGLDDEMREVFLNAYFRGKNISKEKLEAYMVVYRVLCEKWFKENS